MNKLSAAIVMLAIIGIFSAGFHVAKLYYGSEDNIGMGWCTYGVQTMDETIEIDESQDMGSLYPIRMIHIKQIDDQFIGVTGHDYNMDGIWDRVFISGYDDEHKGYNSFIRTDDRWVYEPCTADEDAKPIPFREVASTINRLDHAMQYRTFDNLTSVWTCRSTTNLVKESEESEESSDQRALR